MAILIVIVSFFLDGLLSIYQGPAFLNIITFKPMFTIVSLVLICHFFVKYRPDYYKICSIVGLFYDIMYTNTLLLNTLIFPLLGLIICKIYELVSDCLGNGIIINMVILAIYHVLTYVILVLIGYLPLNIFLLSDHFLGLLITNTIFFMVMYSLIKTFDKRKSRIRPYGL